METMAEADQPETDNRYSKADSISRRKMLLEQEKYERTVAGKWKQKPGEKFHPLWKLVAQISFGMHLLHQQLAKSDDEVIKILQAHVDEIDGFLERTTEDFDLAQKDINERINYLQLPLKHSEVFDTMLDDRPFRKAIVDGNEKIEHIVDRTMAAMKDALKDVQKGLDATRELGKFLMRLEKAWDNRSEEHASVYHAMVGNTEGWSRAFMTLQQKGNTLGVSLVQLGGIIGEIQRRAGMASRRNVVRQHMIIYRGHATDISQIALRNTEEKFIVEPNSHITSPRYSLSPPETPNKALPREPATVKEGKRVDRSDKYVKANLSQNIHHDSEQDVKHTLKSNAMLKLQGRSSEDLHTTTEDVSIHSTHSTAGGEILNSNQLNVPSETSVSGKVVSRKISFAERTRSLTRKITFVKEAGEPKQASPSTVYNKRVNVSSPNSSGARSPISDARSPRSSHSVRSDSRNGHVLEQKPRSNQRPKHNPVDSHLLDGAARVIIPTDTTFSPLASPQSGSPPQITGHIIRSTSTRPKIVTIREHSGGSVHRAPPALKELQANEVRAVNTAAGSLKRPVSKDLPLRHYRSQETLSPPGQEPSELHSTSRVLRRSTSVQVSPTKQFAPPTGSSIYSPEIQAPSVYPSARQQSNPQFSAYRSSGSSSPPPSMSVPPSALPSAQPSSAVTNGQSLSLDSPDGPPSSYIISLSPYTSIVSPPPAESSATPSPLHVRNKSISDNPRTAPTLPPLDLPTSSLDIPSSPALNLPTTSTLDPPASDIAPTALSSINPSAAILIPSSRPSTPPHLLTSATVSGPEPDINPYDLARSDTDTPVPLHHVPSVSVHDYKDYKDAVSPATHTAPTVSSFPSPRSTTFPSFPHPRQSPLRTNTSTLPISPAPLDVVPGGAVVNHTLTLDAGGAAEMEKGLRSPWKKVFGSGIGMNLGSGRMKGHRRSRSDKVVGMTVGVLDARPRSSPNKRVASDSTTKKGKGVEGVGTGGAGGGGGGFMGSMGGAVGGRDGVWISRKNFMKT